MNALKTFVNQIKTYGTFVREYTFPNSKCKAEYYRMDSVTTAQVIYRPNGKILQASFIYTNNLK